MKIRTGFVSNSSSSSFIVSGDIDLGDLKTVKTFDLRWMEEEEIKKEKEKIVNKINCKKDSIKYKFNDLKNEYEITIEPEAIKKYIEKFGKKLTVKDLYIKKIKEGFDYFHPFYIAGFFDGLINVNKIDKKLASTLLFISYIETSLSILKNAYFWLRRFKKENNVDNLILFYECLDKFQSLDSIKIKFFENEDLSKLMSKRKDEFSDFEDIIYSYEKFDEISTEIINEISSFKKEFSKFINWYYEVKKEINESIFDRKTISILIDLFYRDDYYYNIIKNFLENHNLNDTIYDLYIEGSGNGYKDIISYILYDVGRDKWVKNENKIFIFD